MYKHPAEAFIPRRTPVTPILGAAYYPEDWDESEQESDIESMKKAGMNVMRIGEFAWHKMEPRDGEFDFSWLHRIVDKLGSAGIAVVLGTPTATPPIWVEEKDPEMLRVEDNELATIHGGRRHCCSNNPTYRKYSARITEMLAREFGNDPRVVGWQIDNEIDIMGNGCFCPCCRRGFAEYLRKKYGSIENLNNAWNLNLFSQAYSRFEHVPMPRRAWVSPHHVFEWRSFQSESHIDFVHMQADILHRFTSAPVGTDVMPFFRLDYEKLAEKLDVAQFNHYNNEENLWKAAFWMDHMRALYNRPFWNTETDVCWNGGTRTPAKLKPQGYCRANSWLPIALGGEANMYWLWRQHWAGHELMHGAVLYASGRPGVTFGEVQEIAAGFEKASDFLNRTSVDTSVCLQVSTQNGELCLAQPVVADDPSAPNSIPSSYTERLLHFHHALSRLGVRPDVAGPQKSLDGYRALISPVMMTLEIGDLRERIERWVRNGGTWIVGPMTDIRNSVGAHYTDRETGILERLTGAVLTCQLPDCSGMISAEWDDGKKFTANSWLQLFDVPADAEVIARVTGGYSPVEGKALAFRKKLGKGSVIVVGTFPSEEDLAKIYDMAFASAGITRYEVSGEVAVAPRSGDGLRGLALVELGGKPAAFRMPEKMTDILSGASFEGEIRIEPYQVMVLKAD